MQMPLDEGFLRRECPHCERQFKWHHGATPDRPDDAVDPEIYFCPYCGDPAPEDHWWTAEQIEYAEQSIAGPVLRQLAAELRGSAGGQRKSLFKISVTHDEVDAPNALQEPPDMVITQAPCHPWEPIKVTTEWTKPLHCLLCGERFAVT